MRLPKPFMTPIVLSLCMAFAGVARAQSLTLAPSAIEGRLTFQATVLLPESIEHTPQNVLKVINEQSKHLMGLFELAEYAHFIGEQPNEALGVLGLGALENYRIVSESKTAEGYEVTYQIRHRIVAEKRVLSPGQVKKIKIMVPHDPVEIYAAACTDKTYPDKKYFFYYWNPFRPECQARLKGKNRVDVIEAQLSALTPPSSLAAPDYASLKKQIVAQGELHISVLMGFNLTSANPRDLGRVSYEYLSRYFKREGFELDGHRNTPTGPYLELVREARAGKPKVHMSLSLSASDVNSPIVFARRAREAFEHSDLVLYIGHSGLGGNLDLDKITALSSADSQHPEPIKFPNKYQIFYIDSCGSYYFYTHQYALAKRGVHKADIVSNGLAAYFSTQNAETINFLDHFINPIKASTWQEILTDTERPAQQMNPVGFTYLVNVTAVR